MARPEPGTFPEAFAAYISLVPESDINEAFTNQRQPIFNLFDGITEEKSRYAYAPGKWTLKEMLQHLIDAVRIFNFRSLAFARGEAAPLPGFDEDNYAAESFANARSWKSLVSEFKVVHESSELLFQSFTSDALLRNGLANNKTMSVLAIGFSIIGHIYHHERIIEERYFSEKVG